MSCVFAIMLTALRGSYGGTHRCLAATSWEATWKHEAREENLQARAQYHKTCIVQCKFRMQRLALQIMLPV